MSAEECARGERFLDAIRFLARYPNHPSVAFQERTLPEFDMPTVSMTREQVVDFRNDFNALLAFAAVICDVRPENLRKEHLDRHIFAELRRASLAADPATAQGGA